MSVDYFFDVDESTGVLKVLRPLDRDHPDMCAFMRHCTCVLTFDVAAGHEDIFNAIPVRIAVDNVNGPGTSYQLPVVTDQDGDVGFDVTYLCTRRGLLAHGVGDRSQGRYSREHSYQKRHQS